MGRFIVVNTVGAFILVLLGAAGFLSGVLASSVLPMVGVLFGLIVFALVMIFLGRDPIAIWITQRMTMFGLAGTVLGVINVFTHAKFDGDMQTALASGVGLALYSTLTGIVGYLWLSWNLYHQSVDHRE